MFENYLIAIFIKKNLFFFQEVAEICFTRLNLILIAVEHRKYEGGQIFINPRFFQDKITFFRLAILV